MGRPLTAEKPLTSTERVRRHRENKVRYNDAQVIDFEAEKEKRRKAAQIEAEKQRKADLIAEYNRRLAVGTLEKPKNHAGVLDQLKRTHRPAMKAAPDDDDKAQFQATQASHEQRSHGDDDVRVRKWDAEDEQRKRGES